MKDKFIERLEAPPSDGDYAAEYVKYFDTIPEGETRTWDDFYDHLGLPTALRSDFLTASILKQARKLVVRQYCQGVIAWEFI